MTDPTPFYGEPEVERVRMPLTEYVTLFGDLIDDDGLRADALAFALSYLAAGIELGQPADRGDLLEALASASLAIHRGESLAQ